MSEIKRKMKLACKVSEKSRSTLVKVGAMLYGRSGKLLSAGYNGWGFKGEIEDEDLKTTPGVPHAEEVCIGMAARKGYKTDEASLYVSTAPCFACARLIVVSGIKTVYYKNPWWDVAVLDYLEEYGVEVICTKEL